MITIMGIKTKDGIYISQVAKDTYNNRAKNTRIPSGWLVNGEEPHLSFHANWNLVSNVPKEIKKLVKVPNDNYRWVLIDKSMECEKIPLTLQRDKVCTYVDYEWCWGDKYQMYSSLYTLEFDEHDPVFEEIEFEYNTAFECDRLIDSKCFSYTVQKTQWAHQGTTELTADQIKQQVIDKIMFPDIALANLPSKLTKQQTFDIIRQFVNENIDGRVASVTSNYDFCYTVKKKIPLAKEKEFTVDVNLFHKRRKPKFEKRVQKIREVTIFQMAPKPYQTYSVIEAFEGKDHEDLQENIDRYLAELIDFINEPVKDCEHCEGLGVTFRENLT